MFRYISVVIVTCPALIAGFGTDSLKEIVTQAPPPLLRRAPPPVFSQALQFTPWSLWGPCTATCGEGERARVRKCLRGPCTSNISLRFQSHTTECRLKPCEEGRQQTVAGRSSQQQTRENRRRNQDKKPEISRSGFRDLTRVSKQRQRTTLKSTELVWLEWTEWSQCSKSCDGGLRVRTSECVGVDCVTAAVNQFMDCNLINCPTSSPPPTSPSPNNNNVPKTKLARRRRTRILRVPG